jgi:hypothetical protein
LEFDLEGEIRVVAFDQEDLEAIVEQEWEVR